jgi:hypothetical protein
VHVARPAQPLWLTRRPWRAGHCQSLPRLEPQLVASFWPRNTAKRLADDAKQRTTSSQARRHVPRCQGGVTHPTDQKVVEVWSPKLPFSRRCHRRPRARSSRRLGLTRSGNTLLVSDRHYDGLGVLRVYAHADLGAPRPPAGVTLTDFEHVGDTESQARPVPPGT